MNKASKKVAPIIVANTKSYIKSLGDFYKIQDKIWQDLESDNYKYWCAVPSSLITKVASEEYKALVVGAQNFESVENGAYTGCNTLENILEAGAKFIIIGHGETKKLTGYSSEDINNRIKKCIDKNMSTLLCVGEESRSESGDEYVDTIKGQLKEYLKDVDRKNIGKLTVAYEPLWAIGAAIAATSEQAQEAIIVIRRVLVEIFGIDHAKKIKVLYGGSVTEHNAARFVKDATADGVLVGRLSMEAKPFAQMVNSLYKTLDK